MIDTTRLAPWLSAAAGKPVALLNAEKLSGGGIQENWGLDLEIDGAPQAVVLRTTAPGDVSESHDRLGEFRLLEAAFAAGVTVPEPLWYCDDPAVAGRAFAVMRRINGIAAGYRVVKDPFPGGNPAAVLYRLGVEAARLHRVTPDSPAASGLGFLTPPAGDAALGLVAKLRRNLDQRPAPQPVLEWGLRWLELNAPAPVPPVLAHRDFRTGNYMVDPNGLTGILDWEFAGWSDGHEDLGWFCAKCWRAGAIHREAGGIGERRDLYAGYAAESGQPVDAARVHYWEVMAHVRWALITLQQGDRHLSGAQSSLELALTARITDELELELLTLTGA